MRTVVKTSFPVQEIAELQQQLQSGEETYRQQLMRKEAELTRAEETIRREQQQVRQLVHIHAGTCKGAPLGFPRYVQVDIIMCTVVKASLFSLYRRLVSYSDSCNPVENS